MFFYENNMILNESLNKTFSWCLILWLCYWCLVRPLFSICSINSSCMCSFCPHCSICMPSSHYCTPSFPFFLTHVLIYSVMFFICNVFFIFDIAFCEPFMSLFYFIFRAQFKPKCPSLPSPLNYFKLTEPCQEKNMGDFKVVKRQETKCHLTVWVMVWAWESRSEYSSDFNGEKLR